MVQKLKKKSIIDQNKTSEVQFEFIRPRAHEKVWKSIAAGKRRSMKYREETTAKLLNKLDTPLNSTILDKIVHKLGIPGDNFVERCFNLQVFLKLSAKDASGGTDAMIGKGTWEKCKTYLKENHKEFFYFILKESVKHKSKLKRGSVKKNTDISPEVLAKAQKEMYKACNQIDSILESRESKDIKKGKIEAIIHRYEKNSTDKEPIVTIPGVAKDIRFRFRVGLICYATSKWGEKYLRRKIDYYCGYRSYKFQAKLFYKTFRKYAYGGKYRFYRKLTSGRANPRDFKYTLFKRAKKSEAQRLYDKIKNKKNLTRKEAIKVILLYTRQYCTLPGGSRHQDGNAVDFKYYELKNGRWVRVKLPANTNNSSYGSKQLRAFLKTFKTKGKWIALKNEDWHLHYKTEKGRYRRLMNA